MRRRLLIAGLATASAGALSLPLAAQGAPSAADAARLQDRIDSTRGKIDRRRGTERVLSSEVAGYTARIDALQTQIGGLQTREEAVQARLDRAQARLDRLQGDLRSERARLVRLRARLTEARTALADRLVELYTADRPDLMSVVLNSDGFADLLERGEFLQRINAQDRSVLVVVRDAKADAVRTEARLDRLEAAQSEVTAEVQERRDELARVKQGLIDTRVGYDQTRQDKRTALSSVRTRRIGLEDHLDGLEAEQAKVEAALQRAAGGPAWSQGSGQLGMPANGPITGVFGESRPGHMHAGIDLAIPVGTPLHASDGGKVALAGWTGGYGNYTCIQHTGSLSTCYAHQSSFDVSVGDQVSKGQVIGLSGNTGNSTGPHLHYEVRVGGTPVNPMGYL